ncbi:MAG TPA: IS6 family transposase [Dehalococcoidia bacterium]
MNDLLCKYCGSPNVIKFGKYQNTQYYWCKDCKRKFSGVEAIPKMHTPTHQIADALNMYYEGLSLSEIRRNLIQQHKNYISRISAYNWMERFTKLAIEETEKYKPDVGGIWVADETMIELDGKNVWFWDIIDTRTRFLLASHMSYSRTSADARILMEKAFKKAGRYPRIIYTDKLRAYLEGIEQVFGGETHHRQGSPFDIESHHNYIERFHSTLKERTKVMRGLKTMKTAKLFLDGWLVHYNFFRPHMSLKDKTPAEAAGIKCPLHNWRDVVEQPFEITARIPIRLASPSGHKARRKHTRHKTTKLRVPTQSISVISVR